MAIITLSSDVGQQDYLVGAIKGQLLSQDERHNIVDITHYLSNTNYPQAAYICSSAFKHFPPNTFHVVIFNFYDIPLNHVLVARHKEQYIICPDNGILTMIAGERPKEVAKLSLTQSGSYFLSITGMIAKAITHISKNENFFEPTDTPVVIEETLPLRPHIGFETIECQILFIDNFENAVLNLTEEQFEEQRNGRPFVILISRNEEVTTISNHYSSVPKGDCLAWFNSAGYLEIAINKGNVASLFGLQGYHENMNKLGMVTQNKHFYHTIKIFFGV